MPAPDGKFSLKVLPRNKPLAADLPGWHDRRAMTELSSKQRAALRARAHELNPVVQIGHAGLGPAVVQQVDHALRDHELIKVKLARECPLTLDEAALALAPATSASVVQRIGRILVLFRRNPKKPKVKLGSKDEAAAKTTPQGAKSGRQLLRNRKEAPRRAGGKRPARRRKRSSGR